MRKWGKSGKRAPGWTYSRPCVICGRGSWWHLEKRSARFIADPKDDNHPFQPSYNARLGRPPGKQLPLPFAEPAEVISITAKVPAQAEPPAAMKKPCRKAVEPRADRRAKKPRRAG